jgi:hypothetical protein
MSLVEVLTQEADRQDPKTKKPAEVCLVERHGGRVNQVRLVAGTTKSNPPWCASWRGVGGVVKTNYTQGLGLAPEKIRF